MFESSACAEKAKLRSHMRAILGRLAPEEVQKRSAAACSLLLAQPTWRDAGSVMLFAPIAGEIDVWPLGAAALVQGKTLALPRFDPATQSYEARLVRNLQSEISPGTYGIREPVDSCDRLPLKRLDLVLVPGIAFDLHGRRLGRGKGYYDRLLADVRGLKCGVSLDEQLVSTVPFEPHDAELNWILTPTRWLNCSRPVLE